MKTNLLTRGRRARFLRRFFMPCCGATTDKNHVAPTVLSAVCGFSFPGRLKAADLHGKQKVCVIRSIPGEGSCQ
jgi:hypothetical protein